ncbi:MAG: hypothetical protein K0B08_12645 [Bacteroidales bacterium]|nr:hypothetical protein [Bacteroidales bacterium]
MHKELFTNVTFGELQSFGSVAAFPIITPIVPDAFLYITLSEALDKKLLTIQEVSEDSPVPELKVLSKSPLPVLMLSGEELKGAKQNRILNASILVGALASVLIPVNCTGRGRRSYNSPDFKKLEYISSQVFHIVHGQTGVLFFHAGKVTGLDIVSRPGAYARLHGKLVRSYVIDCLETRESGHDPETLQQEARHFLDTAAATEGKAFKSPGLGDDVRIEAPVLRGSILVNENHAVHACCFSVETPESRMAGFEKRRRI